MDELQACRHSGVAVKSTVPCRILPPRRLSFRRAIAVAVAMLALGCEMPLPSQAQTLEEASLSTSPALKQAVQDLRADYRRQQFQRLARNSDRDSLIAAVLIGMPNESDHRQLDGRADVADVAQRLSRAYGNDPLALFTLSLACQVQDQPCAYPEAHDALLRIEPSNAVHWLMLPNGAAPNDAQLHSAAMAPNADSHLRDTMRIVRAALADQSAPAGSAEVDQRELALLLRRDEIEQVSLPKFGAVVSMCKTAVEQRRTDCLEIGRRLQNDRSGAFLSRMIGSAMVRRLVKGTPEDAAAKEMRREYAWLSETLVASKVPYTERLQEEVAVYGEREAWQRAVERLGATRTPPPGWMPKDPQALMLPEERTPAPAQ
jgi:hypothetical protein